MIDVYASQSNYWRHLAPIVRELSRRGHEVRTAASKVGRPWGDSITYAPETDLMIVASHTDAQRWPWVRCAYVEHGAGQTYVDGSGRGDGYAGARGLDNVVLFLAPNEEVAQRWRDRYPQVTALAVGCPALDRFLVNEQHDQDEEQEQDHHTATDVHAPTVAVTFHWSCSVVPESMPVMPFYESALKAVLSDGSVQVLGHGHPREVQRATTMWRRLGVPYESDPDVVLRQADLLVADNTSLMYEAAAIGVPVLALNLPWDRKRNIGYRRDVEHGLRFWSHVPGLSCDGPHDFHEILERALEDPPEAKKLRADAATRAYAHRDGRSAARAADAIEELL